MLKKWLQWINQQQVIRLLLPGLLLTIIFAALFVAVAEDVANHETIVRYDTLMEGWLLAVRPLTIVSISNDISFFGNSFIIAGVTLLLAAWWVWKRNWLWATGLLTSVFGGGALIWVLKIAFHRPRPIFPNASIHETDFSFPSGHSTMSVIFFGFLAYLLISQNRSIKWHWFLGLGLGLIPIFVGVSRLVLGAHYPTDVFAGWDVGALWLSLSISLTTALQVGLPSFQNYLTERIFVWKRS